MSSKQNDDKLKKQGNNISKDKYRFEDDPDLLSKSYKNDKKGFENL